MIDRRILTAAVLLASPVKGLAQPDMPSRLRVATYNVAMYRHHAGELAQELRSGKSTQARQIAEVLQRVRPDIVLLNEFDYESEEATGTSRLPDDFRLLYLEKPQAGLEPIRYEHIFYRPVNTGVDSGMDLDGDGKRGGPADAFGYGRYPGQYGMLLLSCYPIDSEHSHTFSKLLWRDFPGASLPQDPKRGGSYYTDRVLERFRLSSKSFWDVRVEAPGNRGLHLLCSHPTPPVFDGPEDRNGCRNHDEIGLVAQYLSAGSEDNFFCDDRGNRCGGLPAEASCVVLGDLNADPVDGGAKPNAIGQLLDHPRLDTEQVPRSEGAPLSALAHPELNAKQQGDPSHHTSDFSADGHGNLRIDYALPSSDMRVLDQGVFWPQQGEPGSEAVRGSDHRLVWIDLAMPSTGDPSAGETAHKRGDE